MHDAEEVTVPDHHHRHDLDAPLQRRRRRRARAFDAAPFRSLFRQFRWLRASSPDALDALFRKTAEQQYEKTLLFSSVVDLMGLVVARVQPSLNAAYQAVSDTLPISLTSVYNKIKKSTAPSLPSRQPSSHTPPHACGLCSMPWPLVWSRGCHAIVCVCSTATI